MAKILHINPNTVMRAYKIVSNDKLIVSYRNGQYSVTTDEQYIAKSERILQRYFVVLTSIICLH